VYFFEKLLYKQSCEFEPVATITTALYKVIVNYKAENDNLTSYKAENDNSTNYNFDNETRFSQVFKYSDVIPLWMCKWFTTEFNSMRNNEDSLDIESIPNICSHLQLFRIFRRSKHFYSVNPTNVSIQDINICKLTNVKVDGKVDDKVDDEAVSLYICICINNKNHNSCLLVNGIHRLHLQQGSAIVTSTGINSLSFDNMQGDEICLLIRVKISGIVYTMCEYTTDNKNKE